MNCKNCGYQIDIACPHSQCVQAHRQGFCSTECQDYYVRIKEYELEHERRFS